MNTFSEETKAPCSRWEGAGYHSESTASDNNIEVCPIVQKSALPPPPQHGNNEEDDDIEMDEINKTNERLNIVFGNFNIRSLYMNTTLFLFCILSFPLWFGDVTGGADVMNAYILAAFSIFVIFMASGCGLILAIFDVLRKQMAFRKTFKNIAITLYIIGGFFHFVAGCQYAVFYNNLGRLLSTDLSAFGGIWWTQMFYLSAIAVIWGIDLWKPFLNRIDHRIYVCFGLYIFCAMILMCSYLITNFMSIGISYLFGFLIATSWILMYIASVIITKEHIIKPQLDLIKPQFDCFFAVLLFISVLSSAIAYCSTQRIRPQENVYYVGYALFILSLSILMIFDMRFSLYIARYVDPDAFDDNE